jgi:toxin ParE1/3/4
VRRARFLASVRADFLAILTYTGESTGSIAVGETFVAKLRAKCDALAALQATVGRPRPELGADIRSFPYGNYVIFFRYVEGRFEVVRILERHLDIDSNHGGFDSP